MGKTVKMLVGAVVAIGIAIAAPYLALPALAALGITATATAVAVATAVIAIGLSVAAALGMKALGLTVGAPKVQAGPPTIFRQSIADSFIVYGRRRAGGLIVFIHGNKVGSDHFRYFVIAVAGHRCAGNEEFILGDEIVTIDGSNKVTSGKYANAAWLWFDRGESTATANATFVLECDGKWTTDHRGRGIAKIYAKFKMTDAVIEAGMPNIGAVIDGKDDIFDPRDDSTGFTSNAQLVFEDWMQLPREEGGFGAHPDEKADDDWTSAQANVCDETVEGETRYALDGVIVTGAAPSEIRDAMVVNCAGTYTYSEGRHLMRPGYWVPPTATLQEADFAGPLQVSAFMAGDVSANEVQGQFVDPAANYQAAAFATQTLASPPADVRQVSLDLAFCISRFRGERVARIMLNRAQCEKTVVAPMNFSALATRAMDTVQVDTDRYGLSNYAFTIVGWQLSADFGIVLSLKEENEDIYEDGDPSNPDAPPDIQPGDPISPFETAPSMPEMAPVTIEADSLGAVSPGQLPRYVQAKRLAGTADVSTDAAWSLTTESGTVAASVGAATGVIEITAMDSAAAVLVATSELNGVTLSRKLFLTKHLAGTPITGGPDSPAIDTTFGSITSTSHVAISDELEVLVGASGDVDLAAALNVGTDYVGPNGTYAVFGIWRWWNGSSWVDVGTEEESDPDCFVYLDEGARQVDPGVLTVTETKTGLTPAGNEKFQLYARNSSGTREMYFSGTASVTPV